MFLWYVFYWLACAETPKPEFDLPSPLVKKHCLPLTLTPQSPEADQWLTPPEYDQLLKQHVAQNQPIIDFYCSQWADFSAQDTLGIHADSVIADIGTGTGLLPVKLLTEGVRFRRLYAIDIDERSIAMLKNVLALAWPKVQTVVPILSKPTDVSLPERSVDIMLSINTRLDRFLVTEAGLNHPDTLCASMKLALKPNGVLHHFEPSYIDDLGTIELDRQVKAGYQSCGVSLKPQPPIRINQSEYLHWSGRFDVKSD